MQWKIMCILWFCSCKSPVRRVCWFFSGTHHLLIPLVSVHSTAVMIVQYSVFVYAFTFNAGFLELLQVVHLSLSLSFFLSDLPASGYARSHQFLELGDTEISPWGGPRKLWALDTLGYSNSPSPGRSWELGFFSCYSTESQGEALWGGGG